MDWLPNWSWIALPFIVLIGGAALWFAASRPDFWIGVVKSLVSAMLPVLLKRKTPDEEREDRKRASRGEPSARRRPGTGHG